MKNSPPPFLAFIGLLFFCSNALFAQSTACRGSNLWFNGDFEVSTDLIASGWNPFCLPPFYDVITNNTPGFLYPDITDHTPTGGGQFLWSDHSLTPCVFFPIGSDVNILTQELPTVIGQTYHFGVWCYTWCFNVGAEFGLAIDGTIVLTQDLNDIPNCTKGWKYYSYDWVATDTLTDFGVIDVNWHLFGWDMAFDDIEVYQKPQLEITAGADTSLCAGTCTPLWVRGNGIESVIWTGGVAAPNDTLTSACPTQETQYQVIAQDAFGCLDTAFVLVKTNGTLAIELGEDLLFCSDECKTLAPISIPIPSQSFLWSNGATTSTLEICHGVASEIFVTVTENNCQSIDSVQIVSVAMPSISLVSVACAPDFLSYQLVFATQNSNTSLVSEGLLSDLSTNNFAVKNIPINNSLTIEASVDGQCGETLTIEPPICNCPTIAAPLSGGNVEICFGTTPIPSLVVSSITGTKVNWYATATGGNPIATLSNTFFPLQAGTYYAEAIDTLNDCTSATRTPIKLTIRNEVVANAGSDKKVCENTCTTLTASGGTNYEWSNGLNTTTVPVCPMIQTTYTVTVIDDYGCKDTDAIFVDIEAFPIIMAQVPVCDPDLQGWSVAVNLPNNAQLQVPIGLVTLTGLNNFLVKDLPKDINCTLFIQSITGLCTDTTEIIAPECPCPSIQPPASPGEYKICEDKPFPNFNVTVFVGLKADWYASSTGGAPLLQNSTTFAPPQSGTYYAEARNPINGCVSEERSPVTLTLLPLPMFDLPDTLAIGCGEDNSILEATNASTGADFMNTWTFPNGVNPTVLNGNPLKLEVNTSGFYYLEIKNTTTQCINNDTTLVLKTDVPTASFDVVQPKCFGETGTFTVLNANNGLPPYQFSIDGGLTFSTDSIFSNIAPDDYNFALKDATDCSINSNFTIVQPQEIGLQLDSSVTIELGNTIYLNANLSVSPILIDSVLWLPSEGLDCSTCLSTSAQPNKNTTYSIFIKDLEGCTETASVAVNISRAASSIYAPTALNTESTEANNYFTLYSRAGLVEKIVTLRIWNRWGELVFERENFADNAPDLGWNGAFRQKKAAPGVYAWWAKVLLIDGTVVDQEGEVTLVR
jgi:hypothetical protein